MESRRCLPREVQRVAFFRLIRVRLRDLRVDEVQIELGSGPWKRFLPPPQRTRGSRIELPGPCACQRVGQHAGCGPGYLYLYLNN